MRLKTLNPVRALSTLKRELVLLSSAPMLLVAGQSQAAPEDGFGGLAAGQGTQQVSLLAQFLVLLATFGGLAAVIGAFTVMIAGRMKPESKLGQVAAQVGDGGLWIVVIVAGALAIAPTMLGYAIYTGGGEAGATDNLNKLLGTGS